MNPSWVHWLDESYQLGVLEMTSKKDIARRLKAEDAKKQAALARKTGERPLFGDPKRKQLPLQSFLQQSSGHNSKTR